MALDPGPGIGGSGAPYLDGKVEVPVLADVFVDAGARMYRSVIDLGEKLRASGRFRCEKRASLDFSMLDVPVITPDESAEGR